MLHVADVFFGEALNTFKRSKSTNRNQYHPFTRHPMNLCDRSGINIESIQILNSFEAYNGINMPLTYHMALL